MTTIRTPLDADHEELIAALHHACTTAKRLPHILGTAECTTPWDRAHRYIDGLLDQMATQG